MKQVFTKIVTITLAFLVLFSTFSFTVAKHYCGDFLVDVSYVGETGSCNEGEKDDCATVIKKKCCKDEVHQIDGQDKIQKASSKKISFQQVKLFVAFYSSYNLLFENDESQPNFYQYYTPPDLVFDFQVLHEVYII